MLHISKSWLLEHICSYEACGMYRNIYFETHFNNLVKNMLPYILLGE